MVDVCVHCGGEGQSGTYCTNCGWPQAQQCPYCRDSLPLLDKVTRCTTCGRVVRPCPRKTCGKAITIEAHVCGCTDLVPVQALATPWSDLDGDICGQRLGFLSWSHGDHVRKEYSVQAEGRAIWAGRLGDTWAILTEAGLFSSDGHSRPCPPNCTHAIAGLDPEGLFVASQGIVYRCRPNGFSPFGNLTADRIWAGAGWILAFSSDGAWHTADPETGISLSSGNRLDGIPRRVLHCDRDRIVALTSSHVYELNAESGEAKLLGPSNSVHAATYNGHVYMPASGYIRDFSIDGSEMHLTGIASATAASAVTSWDEHDTRWVGALTSTGVSGITHLGEYKNLADAFGGEPTGWLVGFDCTSAQPRHLLAVKQPTGESKLYDFFDGRREIALDNVLGTIQPIFTRHGIVALISTQTNCELVVLT